MPRRDLIEAKKAHVAKQIADLEAGKKVVARVGGHTEVGWGGELAFQKARLAELEWASAPGRTDKQIRDRIRAYEAQLPPEALACKYGVVRGLPPEQIELIAKIELLEVALGIHPGVGAQ